jgi:hypothetical protein
MPSLTEQSTNPLDGPASPITFSRHEDQPSLTPTTADARDGTDMRMSRLNRSQRQDALKVFSAWRRQGFDYRLTPEVAEALTGIKYPDGDEVRLIELAVKYVLRDDVKPQTKASS